MPTKKAKRAVKAKNHVDVRKTEDIAVLKDMMKNNKLMAVLIYADYCGHCHTYMDDTWNGLVENPSRKNGMASIHYDQLESTPLAGTSISGYPTILLLGEDKTPISFKNEQTGQNEIEYPESRNKEKMAEILNSEPETALNSFSKGSNSNLNDTLDLSEESREKRLSSDKSDPDVVIGEIENQKPSLKPKKMASIPDYTDDMLNSQNKAIRSKTLEFEDETPKGAATGGGGGSLYRALMECLSSSKKMTKKRKAGRGGKTRRT